MVSCHSIAFQVRFSADNLESRSAFQPNNLQSVRDDFFKSSVEIHRKFTPALDRSLNRVCGRLAVDRGNVQAFVHSSHELQAACYFVNDRECLLRFSSALVNLLDEVELEFVIGHEIGHFIYQHSALGIDEKSLEHFVFHRAQEISADRAGLIGCADEKAAVLALVKTVSGLETRHLHLDIGQYLSQLSRMSSRSRGEPERSTHPSILLRTRALMWFALSRAHLTPNFHRNLELERLDNRVAKDLVEHVDGPAQERIEDALFEYRMWMAAERISADGRFVSSDQNRFRDLFGDERLNSLKAFFTENEPKEIRELVLLRVQQARACLAELAPDRLRRSDAEITREIESAFRSH